LFFKKWLSTFVVGKWVSKSKVLGAVMEIKLMIPSLFISSGSPWEGFVQVRLMLDENINTEGFETD
jgi:hypothetical protein